jgi:hypothetical protein
MPELKRIKEEIVQKAEELGREYEAKYKGCGQCTFLAIVDALRWGGLEIVPEDVVNRIYPGICFLTAGTNMTGEGTCGAVSSSVMAIGIAMGAPLGSQEIKDERNTAAVITRDILDRYYQKYGSILCKDVQRKHFGKAWDLTSEQMTREFLSITDGCTIMETAGWATDCILTEFDKGNIKH